MAPHDYEKVAPAEANDNSDPDGSGFDSDIEQHDGIGVRHIRTSEETRRHDRETLGAEEEAEHMLAGEKQNSTVGKLIAQKEGSREARHNGLYAERKPKRNRKQGEESELMYAMEAGPRNSDESSGNSSEADFRTLKETQAKHKVGDSIISKVMNIIPTDDVAVQRATRVRLAAIFTLIILSFLALLYGAYKSTSATRHSRPPPVMQHLSNGTSLFAPTTILISLDGFRADFLHRNLTPTLSSFVSQGVSPNYMLPSFPSLTFPNHFTLVTGLYPESHGIVGNTFFNPETGIQFDYGDPSRSMQPEWWNAEPVWETAELAGLRTAIHMWPGSEAHIGTIEPQYVDKYNSDEALEIKVDRILSWLDLASPEDAGAQENAPRPQLIAAYVPNVDADGHLYGPNSTKTQTTITEVDSMLHDLFAGLDARNLTAIVNVIIVSDHGMATTDTARLIQLEDLVNIDEIEHTDGWPLYGLRPYDSSPGKLTELYDQLWSKSKQPEWMGKFEVYSRDFTMPERYHFSQNDRIAPLWIVPKVGWAIVTRDEVNVADAVRNGEVYHPMGLHGYDYEHPLMRAIFVARGPAFPHTPGSAIEPFQNIEVYNIVCDSLGIEPRPNNGTLRLPLQPVGVHGKPLDLPDDPPLSAVLLPPGLPATPSLPATPTEPVPALPPTTPQSAATGADGGLVMPTSTNAEQHADSEETSANRDPAAAGPAQNQNLNWWQWVKGKVDGVKDWATDVFGGHKTSGTQTVPATAHTLADGSLAFATGA